MSSASSQLTIAHTQDKVDHDGGQQGNRQDGWTEAVVKAALPSSPDTLSTPVECYYGVDHGCHGDDGKQGGGDATDAVTEVEETHGQATENDGEVQP